MLRSHSLELSDYSKGLPNEAKERCIEKLQNYKGWVYVGYYHSLP